MADEKSTEPEEASITPISTPDAGDGEGAPNRVKYFASVTGEHLPIPPALGQKLSELQSEIGLPLWLLLQGDDDLPLSSLDPELIHMVKHERAELPTGQKITCLVNSPGGDARSAYELGRMFQRRCGYTVIVVDMAMSAATLFALGSDGVMMSEDSSLGPLDAQILDPETESYDSVLNEVQALERLRAYGLESIDEVMMLMLGRTGKKVDSLLPHVMTFVSSMMRPLMEKVDVIHYNERARILKVGEEYAIRLLARNYPEQVARNIASTLVQNYPEHGFHIDRDEAANIGIRVEVPTGTISTLLESLWEDVQGVNAIGFLSERVNDEAN